jgi:hypothetical protein
MSDKVLEQTTEIKNFSKFGKKFADIYKILQVSGDEKFIEHTFLNVRIEVVTVVNMLTVVFWVVMPCSHVGAYLCFGGTYRLYLKG